MGINLKQQWVATFDGRTRYEHRLLDGQCVEVGEPFKVEGMEIRFSGDPTAPAILVYNCRCTLISQLKGFEIDATKYRQDPDFKGISHMDKYKCITASEDDLGTNYVPDLVMRDALLDDVKRYERYSDEAEE